MDKPTAYLKYYTESVKSVLYDLGAQHIVERIWAGDYTVWRSDPTEISNRLGWLDSYREMRPRVAEIEALRRELRAEGFDTAVLLGMGGSSLAPDMFRRVFTPAEDGLRLLVLDSTDPEAVLSLAERIDETRTVFIVATKSGGTAETLSFFKFFYNRVLAQVEEPQVGRHFLAITDPGSPLDAMAQRLHFRRVFRNDPNVGGRFSVLTYFGLVPAGLMGVDIAKLLTRAEEMAKACGPNLPVEENYGAWLGAIVGMMALKDRDKLTFVLSPSIAPFGDWVEQLIAESTGKDGRGILPVVGEPLTSPEHYGRDRVFVTIQLEGEGLPDEQIAALREAGFYQVDMRLQDRYDLGGLFFLWEFATAIAGRLMNIQPFDQPNVEAAKVLARRMIAAYREEGSLPVEPFAAPEIEVLTAFLSQVLENEYIAIQAYITPTAENDAALQALRCALRDRTGVAVTIGYGPRFLHSTGQLHKGDSGNGHFIQIVIPAPRDAAIPDEPGKPESSLTFEVLKQAQALGDYHALQEAERHVIRFDVPPAELLSLV